MIRTGAAFLWFISVTLALPRVASSSCAAVATICAAYERSSLVFAGDVLSVQPEAGPTRAGMTTRVQFRVLERFKGAPGSDVTLSLAPSSEEFSYVEGQRLLVYAGRQRGAWSTACTRTTHASVAANEALVLRALRDGRPGGAIDGDVLTAQRSRRGGPDIRVVLGRDGAVSSEMKTDFAGRFQTGWLTPGTYVVSVQKLTPGVESRRQGVVAPESGCISLAFDRNH